MRITSRTKAIAFFITLGACLVALAVFLNITWIVFHWRQVVPLVLGIIFFGVIIAGLVVTQYSSCARSGEMSGKIASSMP
jgi:two-component system sensor histidine kinase SenX3